MLFNAFKSAWQIWIFSHQPFLNKNQSKLYQVIPSGQLPSLSPLPSLLSCVFSPIPPRAARYTISELDNLLLAMKTLIPLTAAQADLRVNHLK